MTDVNAAASRDIDDILEPALETRSARPTARPRAAAHPARRAALPVPAVRANDDVRRLTRAIEAQNVRLANLGPGERRGTPQPPPATAARHRLHEIRMRLEHSFRGAVDKRDSDRARGRHDPLNDATIRNTEGALNRAERRELVELRAAQSRPAGPSATRGAAPQRSQAFHLARRATLQYLRTGQTTFGGRSLREIQHSAFEQRALQSQIGSDGGYLVHPEHDNGPIEKLLLQLSPMRSLATVRNISAASFKKPFNVGGASAQWVDEIGSRPETDTPSITELEFHAMELFAQPLASQTLLEDSLTDIEIWLADEVGEAFAMAESVAFLTGNGVKKPTGLLAYDKVPHDQWSWGKFGYVVTGAGGAFASGAGASDCLIDATYRLKQAHRQSASWLLNRGSISLVRQIKDTTGQYIWQPMGKDGEPATLHGYAVNEDEQMPEFGAGTFPIGFGDWKRTYLIVDRIGLNVLRDEYTSYPHVAFKTRKRVGGGAQNFETAIFVKAATS